MSYEVLIVAENSAYPHAYTLAQADDDVAGLLHEAHEFYARHYPAALPVRPKSWAQFLDWESECMRRRASLELCREADFWSALGALPPLYHEHGEIERFLMGEPTHGTWYQQYARLGDRYLTKLVDARDRLTWIKTEDFQ